MADNEYRGIDGLIRVEDDELVFIKGGRLSRAVAGAIDWRIPIPCIQAVVFKETGATRGLLHLVVADAAIPKASHWGTADKQWTITFMTRSQGKRFRELRDFLERCIEYNRQNGIDPLTARRPYLDQTDSEQFDAAKQRLLGDSLIRQPAPDAAPSEVIALAKQKAETYSQSWTDLDSLPARLAPDEPMRLLAHGMVGLSTALVALTDRRVLFHRESPTSRKYDELPLRDLRLAWNSNLLTGGLTFRTATREASRHSGQPPRQQLRRPMSWSN